MSITPRPIEKLKHNMITTYGVDSDCHNDGYTDKYHCSRCEYVEIPSTVIPKKEHKSASRGGQNETCTENGTTAEEYCYLCYDVLTPSVPIIAEGHKLVYNSLTPTCQNTGLTTAIHCSVCEAEFKSSEVIDRVEHKFTDGTCVWCELTVSEGLEYRECQGGYEVTGRGSFSGTELVIPLYYNNRRACILWYELP